MAGTVFAQDFEYRKDTRSQREKEDSFGMYQSEQISTVEILQAMGIMGMNIFKFPLNPFDEKYNILITLDEYEKGEKVQSEEITRMSNMYYFFEGESMEDEDPTPYMDYLDQLLIYAKENTEDVALTISSYSMNARSRLEKKKERVRQNYYWRRYTKANWKLNESVPLLVYASSWWDEMNKLERFCGVVDLSLKEEYTQELLDNSPHYYVISLKVYE